MSTTNSAQLIRTNVWADFLKSRLEDNLVASKFISKVEFGDGNTLNIPSIGQLVAQDYQENHSVTFQSPDLGNFTFALTDYIDTSVAITDKNKRDMFYLSELMSDIPMNMARSLAVRMESDILGLAGSQTSADPNDYNGYAHRFVASGTSNALTLTDIRYARESLIKAAIAPVNLIGIIDPSAETQIREDSEISAHVTNQPRWGEVLENGLSGDTGLQFAYNIEGFDIYTSNYLTEPNGESIDAGAGARSVTAGAKGNMFFSGDPMTKTLMFGERKAPSMVTWRDEDVKADKFSVDAEYGVSLFRPEGLVTIISNSTTTSDI